MLHLANGDAAAQRIREAGLPGEVAVWRDMLSEGPCPNALVGPGDWAVRTADLERRYALPGLADLPAEDARLVKLLGEHDEVVLWSDEDLFCQVNLAYVLASMVDDWIGAADVRLASEGHEGPRDPARTRTAFERRQGLGPRQAALAAAFWERYASDDPEALADLVQRGFPSWRWFSQGLAHVMELFPSDNGLSLAEESALHALHDGALPFHEVVRRMHTKPAVLRLGWGDAQVAVMLQELARAPHPLVRIEGPAPAQGTLRLLADANRVLAGEDAVGLRGIDRWVGGVHLAGSGSVWRWDGMSLRRG